MPSPFIDPAARHPYVLKADRDKPADQQHRFLFRIMTVRENAAFADFLIYKRDEKGEFVGSNENAQRVELLRYTLAEWEGPGAPKFEVDAKGYPTDATLSRVHGELLYELAKAASDVNVLKDETAGKS